MDSRYPREPSQSFYTIPVNVEYNGDKSARPDDALTCEFEVKEKPSSYSDVGGVCSVASPEGLGDLTEFFRGAVGQGQLCSVAPADALANGGWDCRVWTDNRLVKLWVEPAAPSGVVVPDPLPHPVSTASPLMPDATTELGSRTHPFPVGATVTTVGWRTTIGPSEVTDLGDGTSEVSAPVTYVRGPSRDRYRAQVAVTLLGNRSYTFGASKHCHDGSPSLWDVNVFDDSDPPGTVWRGTVCATVPTDQIAGALWVIKDSSAETMPSERSFVAFE